MRVSMDGRIAVDSEVVIKGPGNIEFVGTVHYVRPEGREYVMGIGFTIGEWNERSDWPHHRPLSVQEYQCICEDCVGDIDYAGHAPSR